VTGLRAAGFELGRRATELVGFAGVVAVVPDASPARRRNTGLALSRALGRPVSVRYRPDGRPEVGDGWYVSASHGAGVTLAVAARSPTGCDIEPVVEREPAVWAGLLGPHLAVAELVAAEAGEALSPAATKAWTALEALRKAGQPWTLPLTSAGRGPDGWVVLAGGSWRVATVATALPGVPAPVAVAVAAPRRTADVPSRRPAPSTMDTRSTQHATR
jgi:enediyne polyketide synthase